MLVKIKACPFYGNTKSPFTQPSHTLHGMRELKDNVIFWEVICNPFSGGCGAIGGLGFGNAEDAVKVWNRRVKE